MVHLHKCASGLSIGPLILLVLVLIPCSALAAPEWKKNGKAIPAGLKLSGIVKNKEALVPRITDEKYTIKCKSDEFDGNLEAPNKVKQSGLELTECTGENTEAHIGCTVETAPLGAGDISLALEEGALSEVEAAEAPTERGLLLKAVTPPIATLSIVCVPEAEVKRKITGEVVAEVKRLKEERTFINLLFAVSGGKQKIQHLKEALPKPRTLEDGVNEVTLKTENEFEVEVYAIVCGQEKPEDIEVI
jgi:hypothetical protein